MNKNLSRLTNAANRIEAWNDWKKLVALVKDQELINKHVPPPHAGWRKIDKCIAALREESGIDYREMP